MLQVHSMIVKLNPLSVLAEGVRVSVSCYQAVLGMTQIVRIVCCDDG